MKNNREDVFKRQQKLLQYLKNNGEINVNEISEELKVSPITIRRDLTMFEKKGMVKRFHGGAKLIEEALYEDPSLAPTTEISLLKKHLIAKKAASYVENNDTIFINSGTTALLLMSYLEDKHVIVVTNNGNALVAPKSPNVELILVGGDVYAGKNSLVGEFAVSTLHKIIAAKCFIGVSGISAERGITSSVLQETSVNMTMLNNSKEMRFVLCESSKIGREHNFVSGSIEMITNLITDWEADENELKKLRDKNIKIDVVNNIQ